MAKDNVILDLILGPYCPFCNSRSWPRFHRCPTLKAMKAEEAVRAISEKIRGILDEDPADRFVHEAYDALDNLERTFQKRFPAYVPAEGINADIRKRLRGEGHGQG